MFHIENCPRCLQAISEERLQSTPKVCDSCGFVLNNVEKQEHKQHERRSLAILISLAVAIVGLFVHVVNWGSYSLEIIPLKTAQVLGFQSDQGIQRLADICLDVKKLDCTESMYLQQALKDPTQWVKLGKFQFNRMRYAQASESFRHFFSGGGKDLDAGYYYARALGEEGRVDEASEYYDYVLQAKPKTIQITVAQAYVKMLVDAQRFDQALKVIDKIRRKGQNASQFMDSEYKVIRSRIEPQHT